MKSANRSNALLVELLIVVMFFMLASTVLLQMFSTAHGLNRQADVMTRALNEAQNAADRLYAALSSQEKSDVLKSLGFDVDGEGVAFLEKDGFTLRVTSRSEEREAGLMYLDEVQAYRAESLLFSLPVTRYEEVRP